MSAPAASPFSALAPAIVWQHFADLCRIPRPSKHEEAVRVHLQQWAKQRGLSNEVDRAGNLIVRKAASSGCEDVPTLSLQAHLDMVTQKNSDSAHDFLRDPIEVVLADGWLQAPHTTLGADNGIGVALIMALLDDDSVPHGPLEALFTVDEEAGMGGAQGLADDVLQGRLMLNLDTEEWGEFYLGCAGGADVDVTRQGRPEPVPVDHEVWRLTLTGLRGGHSGVDIHENRPNAIKALLSLLLALGPLQAFRLVGFQGGTARNAIPREAWADIAVARSGSPAQATCLMQACEALASKLRDTEPDVQCRAERLAADAAPQEMLDEASQQLWLHSLRAAPYGVHRMSLDVPGVVETSNNVGVLELTPSLGRVNFMVRSLTAEGTQELAGQLQSLWALSQTHVAVSGHYPGWRPNPNSPLLAQCQRVYRQLYQTDSHVQVIHAGLECGLIAAKYPGMDIVSFGPTIRGAHAPGERVDIASVARTWELLCAIVRAIATGQS